MREVIYDSAMGYVGNGRLSGLGITGERLFGGLVVRGSPAMSNCVIYGNSALEDGGGLFLCADCRSRGGCLTSFEDNGAGASGGGPF